MGIAIGIDLGTTNTVVAAVVDGVATTLADEHGRRLLPSVVSLHPSGNVLVGELARERRIVDPENTIYSIKRLLGRTYSSAEVQVAKGRFPFPIVAGPRDAVLVEARGQRYTLPEISAFVLRRAKAIAEHALGRTVEKAVVTVPANFNELQRASTKVAGRLAGLDILRILNEPTAAALAYGQQVQGAERVAVFDLGGGTFDMTVLDLSGRVFEVVCTAGDSQLGGDDIDHLVAERIAEEYIRRFRWDPRTDPVSFGRLRLLGEEIKKILSSREEVTEELHDLGFGEDGIPLSLRFQLDRATLENLCKPLIDRAISVTRKALDDHQLKPGQMSQVLLVGGATRMPMVARRVAETFGRAATLKVNPDEVVALGAAIQAHALVGSKSKEFRRPSQSGYSPSTQAAPSLPVRPTAVADRPLTPSLAPRPGLGLSRPPVASISPSRPAIEGAHHLKVARKADAAPPTKDAAQLLPQRSVGAMAPAAADQTLPAPLARQASIPDFGELENLPEEPNLATKPGDEDEPSSHQTFTTNLTKVSPAVEPRPGAPALDGGPVPAGRMSTAAQPLDGAAPGFARVKSGSFEGVSSTEGRLPFGALDPLGETGDHSALSVAPKRPAPPLPPRAAPKAEGAYAKHGPPPKRQKPERPSQEIASPLGEPDPLAVTTDGEPSEHPVLPPRITGAAARTLSGVPSIEEDRSSEVSLTPVVSGAEEWASERHEEAAPKKAPEPPPFRPRTATLLDDRPLTPPGAKSLAPHDARVVTASMAAAPLDPRVVTASMAAAPLLPDPRGLVATPPAEPEPAAWAPPDADAWKPEPSRGMASLLGISAIEQIPAGASHVGLREERTLLVDVTPLSLRVETSGGYSDILINANTKVPCDRTRTFSTVRDRQDAVVVRVAQGEERHFANNMYLGEVHLTGIPALPRGEAAIAVTFTLDVDGTLHVKAVEKSSGRIATADLRLAGLMDGADDMASMVARQKAQNVIG